MPIDPELEAVLQAIAARPVLDFASLPPLEAAARMRDASVRVTPAAAAPPVDTTDLRIAGPHGSIPLRIYAPAADGPLGIVVSFHGGGWVVGSIENDEERNHRLAREGNVVIVSVHYRLAPEHRFPVAFDEAYAALLWAVDNAHAIGGDPARIGVSGSSAGANLAAAAALRSRDLSGPRLSLQVLTYPVCDADFDRASYAQHEGDLLLSKGKMIWFWDQYVPDPAARSNPYASPLRAESLAGLPPALILTAEYDLLRDEGELYAERLKEAGVETTLQRYDGMIHGFLAVAPEAHLSQDALAQTAAAFRSYLATSTVQPVSAG